MLYLKASGYGAGCTEHEALLLIEVRIPPRAFFSEMIASVGKTFANAAFGN